MYDAYMAESVTLMRKTGTMTFGERVYTETIVKANIDYTEEIVRDFSGQMITAYAKILLKDTTLTSGDKIKIEGVEHPIASIKRPKVFGRVEYMEVVIA